MHKVMAANASMPSLRTTISYVAINVLYLILLRDYISTHSHMDEQTAFNNPFYNRDLLDLIMRACSWIGPVTMAKLGATCTRARCALKKNKDYLWMRVVVMNIRRENMRPDAYTKFYELWLEYALTCRRKQVIPDWVRDDYYYTRVLPVNGREVFNIAHPTEAQYVIACGQDGKILRELPKRKRTRAVILSALGNNGLLIGEVHQDRETVMLACRQNGLALQHVACKFRACKLASVQQNGLALEHIDKNKRDVDLCLEAVKQNPSAYQFVPEYVANKCAEIYEYASRSPDMFVTFPRKEITKARIAAVLNHIISGGRVCEINRFLRGLKMRHVGVNDAMIWESANGWTLKDVDYDFRTLDVCIVACQRDPNEMLYVPFEHEKMVGTLCKEAAQYMRRYRY
jgi:hypothetical protein